MRPVALAALLALAGCAGGPGPQAQTGADVPRDARGEPVFAAIAAPPAAPAAVAMPESPAVAVPVVGAMATTPPAPPPGPPPELLPPAKPVSCQHYKRCL